MLVPNARVRMRHVDTLLIGVLAVVSGVLAVVTELIAALIPALLLLGFWLGIRREPVDLDQGQLVALGAGLMTFGGFLVRPFSKFDSRKIQLVMALSESLYFRNPDNGAGVFHHLLDAAEEEEVKEAVKEAVLAYPLPAHHRAAADRRGAGPADRGLVRPAVGSRLRLRGRRRRRHVAPAAPGRRGRAGAAERGHAGRGQAPPGRDLGQPARLPCTAPTAEA